MSNRDKFKVGDRVEVMMDRAAGANVKAGDVGVVTDADNQSSMSVIMVGNRHTWAFSEDDLKLITKGDDMEIEVGQVWKGTDSGNSNFYNKRCTVKRIEDNTYVYLDVEGGSYSGYNQHINDFRGERKFKLITNIEGAKKMTKAKGIKLKLGMEVKGNGITGEVESWKSNGQISVKESDGRCHYIDQDSLCITVKPVTEDIPPKAPKKPKKKAVTKKKKVK
jgi:hypothetical protein